jgi:hypothetical protein
MLPEGFWKRGGKRRQRLKNEWLKRFKIALIENDLPELDRLHNEMPPLEKLNELQEAKVLIEQAMALFHAESTRVKATMEQMKKALRFNQASRSGKRPKFDKSY